MSEADRRFEALLKKGIISLADDENQIEEDDDELKQSLNTVTT